MAMASWADDVVDRPVVECCASVRMGGYVDSLECAPCSVASRTADPEKEKLNRQRHRLLLAWAQGERSQAVTQRGDFLVGNPGRSLTLTVSLLNYIPNVDRSCESSTEERRRFPRRT
eukprot:1059677-Pyramimonas_sp.AAC.1